MTRALPTGVVTFLFTDVEGSTKLLRELGDDYADALHEHRRVLRAAFETHHGVEVDTAGDAFFVAFGRASDAVAAAVAAQRSLAVGPIRVRMGLHTGEPQLTDEGYVGLDVHKGARIAAVGHGGQVLMSHATRALVEFDARDLGPHRLKDLTAPERVYQLTIDGLPSDFPRLRTLDAGMRNLPAAGTSFVGREEELGEIDRLLDEPGCRLLTLVGPGGTGKSRLALEFAAGNGHADSAATRLFVDRARHVDPAYALTDTERPHVERICRQVHGMPLGIELAAAWVSMLSCAEIADEIERNISFLQTTMADVPERHRSLRAAFDQSWRLLSEDARRVFCRLSVFRGGFSREAAAAVADAGIAQLHDLVTKSLLRRAEMGRFEMHELLRQYAAERLAETPDEQVATSERHARHYLGRLAERRQALAGPNMADARDELRRDMDNLRLATQWAIGHWPTQETRALLHVLRLFFFVHGAFEGAETFDRLAEAAGARGGIRAEPASVSDVALTALTHWAGLRTDLG